MLAAAVTAATGVLGVRRGERLEELQAAGGTLTPRAYRYVDHVRCSRALASYHSCSQPGPQVQTQDLSAATWRCSLHSGQGRPNGWGSDAGTLASSEPRQGQQGARRRDRQHRHRAQRGLADGERTRCTARTRREHGGAKEDHGTGWTTQESGVGAQRDDVVRPRAAPSTPAALSIAAAPHPA